MNDDIIEELNNEFINPIMIFEYNNDDTIRTMNIDGEVWFVGIDVCRCLDISNSRMALGRLDRDDVSNTDVVDSLNRRQPNTTIINESGLYDLVLDSRKPEAKKFRRWITKDVLPAIRETGSYSLNILGKNEDEKRVMLREQLEKHNKTLSELAKKAGATENKDYSIFFAQRYKGLYGGLTKKQVTLKKGLNDKDDLLDHIGSTELAGHFFSATQTEEKIKKENIENDLPEANKIHYEVSKRVREIMHEIGGTYPEDLKADKHIKDLKKAIKDKEKLSKAALEEENKIEDKKYTIDITSELWIILLIIMSTKEDGIVTMEDLRDEVPLFVNLPKSYTEDRKVGKEPKYMQVIRNLKANKVNRRNFIYKGYAEDIKGGGFKITKEGRAFLEKESRKFI